MLEPDTGVDGAPPGIVCKYSIIAYWVIFHTFLSTAGFFSKENIIFRNTIRMSNSLDPDQARRFVGPDQDPNCLPRLSHDTCINF